MFTKLTYAVVFFFPLPKSQVLNLETTLYIITLHTCKNLLITIYL